MAITTPTPKYLEELIKLRSYHIPLYQRPYNWENEQVSDLWNDIDKNPPGYFLGIVLFKPTGSDSVNFEVVDGQQRLTTLLLLLRAAVKVLEQESLQEANDYQREYLAHKRPGSKDGLKLTLTLGKRDKDKFASILLNKPIQSDGRVSSWRNLDRTFDFFLGKFQDLIKNKGKDGLISFINDKVLRLSFLEVHLGTDSDVYQFFETLNDRGMDLSIADLVKNTVCATTVAQKKDVEDSVLTIDRISETLGAGKFKAFLHHYCLANSEKSEPVPRNGLMDWYSEQIKKSRDIGDFLQHLEKYADRYMNFAKPSRCEDKDKRWAFSSLEALGVTRCYPLLLMGEEKLSKKDFLKLCHAVEILTFRHSTVLKRDAKVLEGSFYSMIGNLRKGALISDILEIFRMQDAMKLKSDEQFRLAFTTEFVPINHKVARYALSKIEEHISGKKQAKLDWNDLTLEHILAEKLDWDGRQEYLEWLGNLTLLSPGLNNDAGNKPFSQKKKKVYEKEKRIKITQELLKYPDFTKDTVVDRQKELAEYAVTIWNIRSIH